MCIHTNIIRTSCERQTKAFKTKTNKTADMLQLFHTHKKKRMNLMQYMYICHTSRIRQITRNQTYHMQAINVTNNKQGLLNVKKH